MPRDFATDAALRPQSKWDGPDHWATPDYLITALITHILPGLPPTPVWEVQPVRVGYGMNSYDVMRIYLGNFKT